jgi:hypothetical protein
MEVAIEQAQYPSYSMDHVSALHKKGLHVYTNYFVGRDVKVLVIGLAKTSMREQDLSSVDAWVHEFIELSLFDIIYPLHNRTHEISLFDDSFNITIPHLISSHFTNSWFKTRDKWIKITGVQLWAILSQIAEEKQTELK